jgi:sporulation protein YlmC with PRC-barrel domain
MQEENPTKQVTGVNVRQTQETPPGINPQRVSALTVIGLKVKSQAGEDLGKIVEVVLDLSRGTISYLVLSVGGFAGVGDRFFAIPLHALTLDTEKREFSLKAAKKNLKKLRGFDKHNWPTKAQWPADHSGASM